MSIEAIRSRAANEIFKKEYQEEAIKNYCLKDESGILYDILTVGENGVKFDGQVEYYIDEAPRVSVLYPNNTTHSYSSIDSDQQRGDLVTSVYDQIFIRATMTGTELRDSSDYQFINKVVKIETEEIPQVFRQQFLTLALRDGTGFVANYNGAGETITAGSEDTSVAVDNVNVFVKGQYYDKVNSSDTVENDFIRCTNVLSRYGAGNISLQNDDASDCVLASGDYFALPNSISTGKLNGLDFIIDDGTNHSVFPRNISGSGNQTVTRSDMADCFKAIYIDYSSATIDFTLFDDILQRLAEEGDAEYTMFDLSGSQMAQNYRAYCEPGHVHKLGEILRSLGSAFRFGTVEAGSDDVDFKIKRPSYGTITFGASKLIEPNKMLFPCMKNLAARLDDPVLASGSDDGSWQKQYGADVYEQVRVSRCQLFANKLTNMVKVVNVAGRTVSS